MLLLVGWFLLEFATVLVPGFGGLEDGVDDIKQLIEGHVVAVSDEAVEIGIEVLDIEEFIAVDFPADDDVFDCLVDFDEAGEANDVFNSPVDLALPDEFDLLAEFEDVGAVQLVL